MTYRFDGNNYILVFKKGEEVCQGLTSFVNHNDLASGWIQGVGGALEVEIGYYNLEKKTYEWQSYDQTCEIVSLLGNIAIDEKKDPALHLHGVFADEDNETIGGHVRRLVVAGTCEIFIHVFEQPLMRAFDGETGLKLLQLE